MNEFVCDVSLYVVETPKASIKYHKPPLPIIPFGIVAYSFVGQPFSKQLYTSHHFTPHGRYELNKSTSLPMCAVFDTNACSLARGN